MAITPAEVKQRSARKRNLGVKCPLCGEYIPRDGAAWRVHMEYSHSADADSWDDTGERGGGHGQRDIPGLKREDCPFDWGAICYGCGATFESEADLVTHLSDKHSAS
jgi:hypothetical protein